MSEFNVRKGLCFVNGFNSGIDFDFQNNLTLFKPVNDPEKTGGLVSVRDILFRGGNEDLVFVGQG